MTGILFQLANVEEPSTDRGWSHHWLSSNGEKILSYCNEGSYHWLQFPGLADFQVSSDARQITCFPTPKTPHETIRHLLLDQVMPRCLAHHGKVMLHSSAVRYEQGLLLFLGDSGTGKSTLAGNFHQAGRPVVSDDCLCVEEIANHIVAVPSYSGLRLWEDSLRVLFSTQQDTQLVAHYSTKRRVSLDGGEWFGPVSDIPIRAMIVLSSDNPSPVSKVTLDPLSHREAFIALMKQSFHLNVMDIKRIKYHVQAVGRIAPRLPSFRLSMPHDYDLLPLVRQKILEAVLSLELNHPEGCS